MAEVSELLHFAGVTVPGPYWEISPGHPAYYWLPDTHRLKHAEILQNVMGDKVLLIVNSGGVMAMPGADDYLEFSYKLFEAPEDIDKIAIEVNNNGISSMRNFFDIGFKAFLTASDIADNHGPFFDPEQMDRFIIPYLKKFAAEAKKYGAFSLMHTDGNINSYLDLIAESEVSAIQAIDPVAGMDIQDVQTRYSDKLCVCGNLDCGLVLTGTPEAVYNETVMLLNKCKTRGSFIMGLSNAAQCEIPVDNYLAYISAWEKHGQYN